MLAENDWGSVLNRTVASVGKDNMSWNNNKYSEDLNDISQINFCETPNDESMLKNTRLSTKNDRYSAHSQDIVTDIQGQSFESDDNPVPTFQSDEKNDGDEFNPMDDASDSQIQIRLSVIQEDDEEK